MRVLVAEDGPAIRAIVSEMVRHLGHEVVEANNGKEARNLILEHGTFDAIISDNDMPEMNGVDLFRWFRTEFEPVAITTLIISSGLESESIEELRRDYPDIRSMPKPVHFGDLRVCF